jgi:hypothetical protein
MELSTYLYVGGTFVVLLLIGVALSRKEQPPQVNRPRPRGPANIRYVCTKCAGEFTHTNRTISAWEKGSRRFFCNACHKEWRSENPVQSTSPTRAPQQEPANTKVASLPAMSSNTVKRTNTPTIAGTSFHPSSKAPSGCLGMALLLVLVPSAIVYVTLWA